MRQSSSVTPMPSSLLFDLTAVVAMTPSRVIGLGGGLPWRLPEDLKTFKRLTMGHPVLMGRKTWESIGRPLPGRQNIVLSRDETFRPEGAAVVHAIDELADLEFIDPEIMVIGGAAVYGLLLPRIRRMWVSRLRRDYEGDTWFPPFEGLFPPPEIVEQNRDFDLLKYERR